MTDPKRWCDDPQALSEMEKRVLLADAHFGPPQVAQSEVWTNLAAGLGAGVTGAISGAIDHGAATPNGSESLAASGTAVGGGTGGSALRLATVVKSALVGVGIGASVAAVNHYLPSRAGASSPWSGSFPQASSMVRTTDADRPSASSSFGSAARLHGEHRSDRKQTGGEHPGDEAPFDEQVATPPARVIEPGTSSDQRSPSSVGLNSMAAPAAAPAPPNAREESQLISSARTALRGGDAAGALQLLDRVERRYPRGVLVQEREALRVEALAALGRTAEARAHADAFVRAYPKSPHLARVKSCTAE
jgi:hypothetical protein